MPTVPVKKLIDQLHMAWLTHDLHRRDQRDAFRAKYYKNAMDVLENKALNKINVSPADISNIEDIGPRIKKRLIDLIEKNIDLPFLDSEEPEAPPTPPVKTPESPKTPETPSPERRAQAARLNARSPIDTPFEKQLGQNQSPEAKKRTGLEKELMSIHGIGAVQASSLVERGITLANIRQHLNLLTPAQRLGVLHHEDFQKKIPRSEMEKHNAILTQVGEQLDLHTVIVGSYRRGLPESGDIDALVTSPSGAFLDTIFEPFVMKLREIGYITGTLSFGKKMFTGACRIGPGYPFRRIDLRGVPLKIFPFMLLYFTGSKEHNVLMRREAIKRGYSLNEYGLTPMNPSIKSPPANMTTEKQIFDFLGLPYREPHQR